MAAWRLNTFLTTYRAAVDKKYPGRTKLSDGTIGDLAHQKGGISEHLPDADGSVDAWDLDVNLLGSTNPVGTAAERVEMRRVLEEFQKQPQAQLWIFQRQIANRDIGPWKVRPYFGASPHDHHAHLQSRQSLEGKPYSPTDIIVPAINAKPSKVGSRTLKFGMEGEDVAYLQRWLGVEPDSGYFGELTKAAVIRYQTMRKITVDGICGSATWREMGVK